LIELVNYEMIMKYKEMTFQSEESNQFDQHPFWENAGEYASNSTDTNFISEMAYMLVTLYKSEVA